MSKYEKHLSAAQKNFRQLGAYIRLAESVIKGAESELWDFATKDEKTYILRMLSDLDMLRLCAKYHLRDSCCHEDADPSELFYGRLGEEPVSQVDAEVTGRALDIATDLFAPKPDTWGTHKLEASELYCNDCPERRTCAYCPDELRGDD